MQLIFEPGAFSLGLAVGVLGLVLVLSLIVAYAYDERTLLVFALYLASMVVAPLLGAQSLLPDSPLPVGLLVAGPALMAALQLWLLKNRRATPLARAALGLVALASTALLAIHFEPRLGAYRLPASLGWSASLLVCAGVLMAQSWHTTGPWKWWLLLGHLLGLGVATVSLMALGGPADPIQLWWPPMFMLLLQVPPVYLSLVWRSRLLNESQLRSAASDVTDPLTGLATSRLLVERLMRVISRAPQSSTSSAIFLIEVQNWNGLLQELGGDFNEKLLLEAALRLRRAIGDNDLAARMGNRRFAVLAQGLPGDQDIDALATRLVVTGLRIDSPLLSGVEFRLRVLVCRLRLIQPRNLPATQAWLGELTEQFARWPKSHRTRSILLLPDAQVDTPAGMKIDSAYE